MSYIWKRDRRFKKRKVYTLYDRKTGRVVRKRVARRRDNARYWSGSPYWD